MPIKIWDPFQPIQLKQTFWNKMKIVPEIHLLLRIFKKNRGINL